MSEYIVYIPDDMHDHDELFVGDIRKRGKELIRCNDCKWYELDKKLHCGLPYGVRLPDDYCSAAQRK